ncbi:hypothetical protein [Sandaracinus amylolyticus]|uniref:hypothetical protein n=1 Tax=Sandaracinus amylolyticus TaxID=927083 RepID=UPI001F25BE29|nr:hypothetical protein [Sandaracinus amylolyticus]
MTKVEHVRGVLEDVLTRAMSRVMSTRPAYRVSCTCARRDREGGLVVRAALGCDAGSALDGELEVASGRERRIRYTSPVYAARVSLPLRLGPSEPDDVHAARHSDRMRDHPGPRTDDHGTDTVLPEVDAIAMGRRRPVQQSPARPVRRAAETPRHRFTKKLNELLEGMGFDPGRIGPMTTNLACPNCRPPVEALPATLLGARDRALLLVGWAAALRRSELVSLQAHELRWTPDRVELRIGERALTGRSVARIVQRAATAANLEGEGRAFRGTRSARGSPRPRRAPTCPSSK